MKFVLSVLLLLFLTFGVYCLLLVGLAWLIARQSRLARVLGTLGAILLFLHHAGGAARTVMMAHDTGWNWLAVVGLIISAMLALMFGGVACLGIGETIKKAPR